MEPYLEFYSDLDLLIKSVEQLKEKCHEWWLNDTPFCKAVPEDSVWLDLEDALQEVQDALENKPFFGDED